MCASTVSTNILVPYYRIFGARHNWGKAVFANIFLTWDLRFLVDIDEMKFDLEMPAQATPEEVHERLKYVAEQITHAQEAYGHKNMFSKNDEIDFRALKRTPTLQSSFKPAHKQPCLKTCFYFMFLSCLSQEFHANTIRTVYR